MKKQYTSLKKQLLHCGVWLIMTFIPTGLFLDFAQLGAWSLMYVNHVQDHTPGEALRRTFDPGQKCSGCTSIESVRVHNNGIDFTISWVDKPTLLMTPQILSICLPSARTATHRQPFTIAPESYSYGPLKPPPRENAAAVS